MRGIWPRILQGLFPDLSAGFDSSVHAKEPGPPYMYVYEHTGAEKSRENGDEAKSDFAGERICEPKAFVKRLNSETRIRPFLYFARTHVTFAFIPQR